MVQKGNVSIPKLDLSVIYLQQNASSTNEEGEQEEQPPPDKNKQQLYAKGNKSA